jgi:predicted house-cleaning NTP pyrophosphatase (Maf/HAM1 superfamily)
LITCDQVVLHKGCILEKPEDEGEARRMIAGYAEAPASTVGSTVVTHVRSGKRVERVDTATVCFNLVVIEVCLCVYMRHRGVCVCVFVDYVFRGWVATGYCGLFD